MNSIFATKSVLTASPKVGDILVGTYGYEACIAVFAKVIKVTGKSVCVVELSTYDVYKPNMGGMYWTSAPLVNVPVDITIVPLQKLVKPYARRDGTVSYCVKWTSYMNLHPWNGEAVECYNVH